MTTRSPRSVGLAELDDLGPAADVHIPSVATASLERPNSAVDVTERLTRTGTIAARVELGTLPAEPPRGVENLFLRPC